MIGTKKTVLLSLFLFSSLTACTKPQIKTALDHFPTGQSTPEGVACDFARVFITKDSQLLQRISIRPYGSGSSKEEYVRFLKGMSASLAAEKTARTPDPKNPVKIVEVFAARNLSKQGPSSYGYASFEFQGLMFVDVEVLLHDGSHYTDRTLVIKDRDGNWYVHPAPFVSPLLTDGLDQEMPSTQTLAEAHKNVQ